MSISYKLRELASSHSFVCLFFNMSGYLFNFLDVQVSFFLQIENDLAITDYNFIFPCKNLTYIQNLCINFFFNLATSETNNQMNNNNSILNCFLASRNPIEQSNVFEWYKYWSNINRKLPFSHEVEHQQEQSKCYCRKR